MGEDCKVELNFNKVTTNPPDLHKDAPPPMPMPDAKTAWACGPPCRTWRIGSTASRPGRRPTGPLVEVAHRSTTVSHLMNVCRQLGEKAPLGFLKQEQFTGDDEANVLGPAAS